MSVNVLLIGSGGREHALAWRIARSPLLNKLWIAPGNAGTAQVGTNIAISPMAFELIYTFVQRNAIDLVVIGPDDPLVGGLADYLRERGVRVFGPSAAAAHLEGSKVFAKQLMEGIGVPTAKYGTFSSIDTAAAFVASGSYPVVIKASGLALGKGSYICQNWAEAQAALTAIMLDRVHGEAGSIVVIEEFLTGREVSLHVVTDGTTHVMFPPSQDHKRRDIGNTGPMTGGMGTIAPVPWFTQPMMDAAFTSIVVPTLAEMERRGRRYTGCLYPGLMVADDDAQRVLEFNCRFGDPEAQAYAHLLQTDLLSLIIAVVDGELAKLDVRWNSGFAVNIVLASGGYPGSYVRGKKITGLDAASSLPGVMIFHAGTAVEGGDLVTAGGRVLGVSAVGVSLGEALTRAYDAVDLIDFPGKTYRPDIGMSSAIE